MIRLGDAEWASRLLSASWMVLRVKASTALHPWCGHVPEWGAIGNPVAAPEAQHHPMLGPPRPAWVAAKYRKSPRLSGCVSGVGLRKPQDALHGRAEARSARLIHRQHRVLQRVRSTAPELLYRLPPAGATRASSACPQTSPDAGANTPVRPTSFTSSVFRPVSTTQVEPTTTSDAVSNC